MKDQDKTANVREEFSVEFGDVNGTKLYEIPLMGGNKNLKKEHDKKKTKPI